MKAWFFLPTMIVALSLQDLRAATVTSTADAGPGSLREALATAANGETINFAVTGAITLSSGELVLNQNVNVAGPGAARLAIQRDSAPGTPAFRIFDVGGFVRMAGLTIRNGLGVPSNDSGGGIYNRGNLILQDCVLERNSTPDRGGGIYNSWSSSLLVSNCVFVENRCTDEYGEGGGLYVFGNVRVLDSTFIGNSAPDRGGGLHVDYFGAAVLNGCTFTGNHVQGREPQGAGIYNYGWLAMTNCTLSGNVSMRTGGGIHNDALSLALRISSCTIVSNTALVGGGGILLNGFQRPDRANFLHNSIVAVNAGGDIYNSDRLFSEGFNLLGAVGGIPVAAQATDQFGVGADALHLGALRNNGGPTFTHALSPDSVAFDAGDDAHCPATDQRGAARPHYSRCDVGAFELAQLPPTLQCVETNVECTSSNGAVATVTVTVADPDGDALNVVWEREGAVVQTDSVPAGGPNIPAVLSFTGSLHPEGNVVRVVASDGLNEPVSCLSIVDVLDTTAPTITGVTATPSTLSPLTHKLVPVTLAVAATDACGPVTTAIKSVTSSDPVTGRKPDWEITGPLTLNLRAELSSPKRSRVYTIAVECTDAAGNFSAGTVTVTVPVR